MRTAVVVPVLWAVSWALLPGCAVSHDTLRSASSGQIGCPPRQIGIADDNVGSNTATWTATCGDRTYYCSMISTSETLQTNCAPASPAAVAAPAAPAPAAPSPAAPAPAAPPAVAPPAAAPRAPVAPPASETFSP